MSSSATQSFLHSERIKNILSSKGFICGFLALTISLFSIFELPPLHTIEESMYDLLNSYKKNSPSQVVLIEIDEKSISKTGSWPWPRSHIARMISLLKKYGAKGIGINLLYPEREMNPGIDEINKIRKSLRNKKGQLKSKALATVDKELKRSLYRLDNDRQLERAINSATNVILPSNVAYTSDGSTSEKLPYSLRKQLLIAPQKTDGFIDLAKNFRSPLEFFQPPYLPVAHLKLPYDNLIAAAKYLGHTAILTDSDGIIRRHPLFIEYQDRLMPSLPLQLALAINNQKPQYLKFITDQKHFTGVTAGSMKIRTDKQFNMLINYDNQQKSFMRYSFIDVLNGSIPAKDLQNKVVIIGITSPGHYPSVTTPLSSQIPPSIIAAEVTANILTSNFITRPTWGWLLESGITIYFMLFLLFIIPKVNLKVGSLILSIFLLTWLVTASVLFLLPGYWLHVFGPVIYCLVGFGALQLQRTISGDETSDENTETNKMLGLTFQSQGMLDMAFDKFMKCSLKDPSVKDLLYNLGLDFERKRMHNKAVAVYEYIARAGKFKDIKDRIVKLKKASEQVVIGPSRPRTDATLMLGSVETKPTLGRYEVIKELGQGAIGTVYLGRDPKINREVAIKVLRYDEVSEDQLSEVKKRFYREAEAAGRLNHPNIVTIYDAGEDYDLTYMAMELLSGKDLATCCKEKQHLAMERILEIIAAVADALEYAHKNGVVHRDIKPANIMILDDGQVKVADFGIARIIDSSKTHTGDILGTPNYMSPEQVAGKKVDGRSDLFSLGAVMYELITGEKPFQSETMAEIMYNIANATFTPVKKFRKDVPDCCLKIVNKLLSKGVTKRYQNAGTVASEVRTCRQTITG